MNNDGYKKKNLNFEFDFWKKNSFISGTDEVGRGSLAGPIVVASVVFPAWIENPEIQDSKTLSSVQRSNVFEIINKVALDISICFASVDSIEKDNPSMATKKAMIESIKKLKIKPSLCLIDGEAEVLIEGIPSLSIVKGDSKSISIAAASIVAKVTRDNFMKKMHFFFPEYYWFSNKGYPDKKHIEALLKYGFCFFHRKNYEPIKSLLNPNCNLDALKKKYLID